MGKYCSIITSSNQLNQVVVCGINYMKHFKLIANVSEYYATTHDRKVVDDSKNILDLVKKPNKFTAIIVCIGLIIIIIIVLVVSLIRKIVRKSRKKKNIHNTNR